MKCALVGLDIIEQVIEKTMLFNFFNELILNKNISEFYILQNDNFEPTFFYIFKELYNKYNIKLIKIEFTEFFTYPTNQYGLDYNRLIELCDYVIMHSIEVDEIKSTFIVKDLQKEVDKAYQKVLKCNKEIIYIPKQLVISKK